MPGHDSLIVAVNALADVRHAPPDLTPAAIQFQVDRFRRAARICEAAALAADSRLLHQLAAQLYLAIGDVANAENNIGRGRAGALDSVGNFHRTHLDARVHIALARERPVEARTWAESLFALPGSPLAQYRSMLGRLSEGPDTSVGARQNATWRQILVGVLPAGLDSLERQMAERLQGAQRHDFLQITTLAGFHLRRTGPALDTAARHPVKRFQAWFARGDAAKARAALAEFDRDLLARHPATPDDGGWLFSAESHLELGDSATAFQRMQEFGRRWSSSIAGAYIIEMQYFQSTTPRLWGRAWLLYGDLALARNAPADARRAYRMVVGLWEQGEAPVQPMVARAREALARLN